MAETDLISRQAAIDAINALHESPNAWLDYAVDAMMALPSTQPETAKRIVGKSRDGMTLWYQCDMCNEMVDKQDVYCRGCGRRFVDE